AHLRGRGGEVRLFSRTRDNITESFPELVPELAAFADELVLDGEIVAYRPGQGALVFGELQKRLGRKKVSSELMQAVPAAFVAFDVLSRNGPLLLDESRGARGRVLDEAFATRAPAAPVRGQLSLFGGGEPVQARVLRVERRAAVSAAELEELFAA